MEDDRNSASYQESAVKAEQRTREDSCDSRPDSGSEVSGVVRQDGDNNWEPFMFVDCGHIKQEDDTQADSTDGLIKQGESLGHELSIKQEDLLIVSESAMKQEESTIDQGLFIKQEELIIDQELSIEQEELIHKNTQQRDENAFCHQRGDFCSGLKCSKPNEQSLSEPKNTKSSLSPGLVHSDNKSFTCPECGDEFPCKSKLASHLLDHLGVKPFLKLDLTKHLAVHTEYNLYSCSVCSKSFSQKSHLTKHMAVHTKDKPFSCTVCSKSFLRKPNLTSHLAVHTGDKFFSCSVCLNCFTKSPLSPGHVHSDNKSFTCAECGDEFPCKSKLASHLLDHLSVKPLSKTHLTKHPAVHTEYNPYSCSVCSKSFSQKSHLTKHMAVHTKDKPFSCTVCSKSFLRKPNLTSHLAVHTGGKFFSCSVCLNCFTKSPLSPGHVHSDNKSFTCAECGDEFPCKSKLASHLLDHLSVKPLSKTHLTKHPAVHTEYNPYSCSVCSKSFSQKSHLTKHMAVHTKEKPFSCTVCSKSFTQKSNLTTHLAVHTGDNPFSCSVCSKSFSYKSTLNNHQAVHTKRNPFLVVYVQNLSPKNQI